MTDPCQSCQNELCKEANNLYAWRNCEKYKQYWDQTRKNTAEAIRIKRWKDKLSAPGTWRYLHPDHVRRLLRQKPCDACNSLECDTPCEEYMHWWNVKMASYRKATGLEEGQ